MSKVYFCHKKETKLYTCIGIKFIQFISTNFMSLSTEIHINIYSAGVLFTAVNGSLVCVIQY